MDIDPKRTLQYRFPEIAKEWHPTLNYPLTPKNITYGSNKKVWWQCPEVKDHIYDAIICDRTNKKKRVGCSFCRGNMRVSPERSLATLSPEIAKEWHPTLNAPLTPKDIFNGSSKIVWWQCPKNEDHTYEAVVNSRTGRNKNGCSYCGGNIRVSPERSLATLSPEIAKEWHPTLNSPLTPKDVFNSSHQKVWWQCPKNKEHVWDARIQERTGRDKTSCRFCGQVFQISRPEMRILAELRSIFKNVISQKKITNKTKNVDIDIFLYDLKLGIEYDGFYFHNSKSKKKNDLIKNQILEVEGIDLIRVREFPLNKIKENDLLIHERHLTKNDIDDLLNIIKKIKDIKPNQILINIDEYISKTDFLNHELYQIYLKNFPSPLPEHSLKTVFPDIAKEWHLEKNHPLLPEDISPGSSQKVWWQCKENKRHVWDSVISSRTGKDKRGCPFCGGKRISPERSLATLSPEIAKEWHPTFNAPLTPKDIFNGSSKKVWWQCPEVKDHIYDAIICDRTNKKTRVGCSFCRGNMRVSPERSLATLSPEIAKEWHPTLNAPLTPKDIFNGSNKIVWWQCPEVKDHVYESDVNSRTGETKRGCSLCRGNIKVSPERSLATLSPEIAKEWHPTLNSPLTPKDVFNSSHQKVWWQCPKNKEHVWDARILDRTRNDKRRSKGCRICR